VAIDPILWYMCAKCFDLRLFFGPGIPSLERILIMRSISKMTEATTEAIRKTIVMNASPEVSIQSAH
jgi:hypothetical protein